MEYVPARRRCEVRLALFPSARVRTAPNLPHLIPTDALGHPVSLLYEDCAQEYYSVMAESWHSPLDGVALSPDQRKSLRQ